MFFFGCLFLDLFLEVTSESNDVLSVDLEDPDVLKYIYWRNDQAVCSGQRHDLNL